MTFLTQLTVGAQVLGYLSFFMLILLTTAKRLSSAGVFRMC